MFCELYSCLVEASTLTAGADEGTCNIVGIILSGGPSSVYDTESPHVQPSVWDLIAKHNIPVLGICYGMQEIACTFGGEVSSSSEREFGRAMVRRTATQEQDGSSNTLLSGIDSSTGVQMWMSHGDKVTKMPAGFIKIAHTDNSEHAAIAWPEKNIFGLQFHPEVTHSIGGKTILGNFVLSICKAPADWNMRAIGEEFVQNVRETVGPTGRVIGAVSGGVDSTVAAVLLHRAIGDRFHAVMVDNGCLRKAEGALVVSRLRDRLGLNLHLVDASQKFLSALEGVSDPEQKRKTIGRLFIETFQEEATKIGEVDYLLQGTLSPDVIESISYKGPSATIKTHHNVGGLPATMKLKLIEPLRELFKDEVRELGVALGIASELVWRHPFPGPGLAIRVLGALTRESLDTLREADDIMIQEITKAGVYRDIGQAFVVRLLLITIYSDMGRVL